MSGHRIAVTIASFCVAVSLASIAQKPSGKRPAYDGSDSLYAPQQIRVDQDCHLLPDPAHLVIGKKARPIKDPILCHLENIEASNHVEEKVTENEVLRNRVEIAEHEFVLQNVNPEPVLFLVEQLVPQGWVVDSDPQPSKIVGSTAVFRAFAQPGEIVHMHVGLRRTTPMKTKRL